MTEKLNFHQVSTLNSAWIILREACRELDKVQITDKCPEAAELAHEVFEISRKVFALAYSNEQGEGL